MAAAVTVASAVLLQAPAGAQTLPPQAGTSGSEQAPVTEVIVTGSRIKRADAETAENVQVISSTEILNSGQETVADYLRTISSTFGNSFNEGSNTDSFAPGAAAVGLRGLSPKDTLVLLDGRRMTNYGLFQNLSDSFVDLNVIPLAAIDHIEILKSGGSAIYGSDAVAGVINIILKQNTTEKAVEVGTRFTTEGGANARDANLRLGFGDFASQGFNVFVTGSVYKRDQLLFSQRANTATQDYTALQDGVNWWHIGNQYAPATPGPFPTCGSNGLKGSVISNGLYGPGCYYNDANDLALSPEAQRANLTATANLRLSDTWTGYGNLFLSNEESRNHFTPDTLNGSAIVVNPATGGATSISNVLPPTNPSSLGGLPTPINYGFQSVGDRDSHIVSNTYRLIAGLKGTWLGWDIDGGYGHSENHVSVEEINYINAPNLVADIADGAFDFLNPASTPAANAALGITETFASVAKLDSLDLKGSKALFDLPGGPLTLAIGMELRHESVDDKPGAALAGGEVMNSGVTRVVASRNVYAAFGEFDFPILKSLDADLALREEHYSGNIGDNLRPQVTVRWQPLSEITMRAVLADGFRAPSLAEASTSTSLAHQTVFDPLDPQGRSSETIGFILAGNPLVKPETSKNVDLGIVFSPTSYLSFSADYYSIFLYHVISTNASAPQIIANPAAYPGELLRGADGTIIYAEALYSNEFEIHTSGLDGNADLSIPLWGENKLKLSVGGTSVFRFEVNQGGRWADFAGTSGWDYLSPISGGGPVPRFKGSASVVWQAPGWAAGATLNYVGSYGNAADAYGLTQKNVASFESVDLNGEYRGLKNFKFTLSVVNLFNRQPPYDSGALNFLQPDTPYDPYTYDDFGRMVDFHVSYTF
ncbi:MAG TPA: TonB-dependent receptor [Steroidobacteraceae bacterium]|nr:TonB-dependent receptor [Steroidobacteraceae bacterium]